MRPTELRIEHGGSRFGAETTIGYLRDPAAITTTARATLARLLDTHFDAGVYSLVEIVAFKRLQAKATSVGADVQRLELAIRQLDLDRERLVASDTVGEKFAAKMADLATKKADLASRIEIAKAGVAEFHRDLAIAEKAAREAVRVHLSLATQAALAETNAAVAAARAAVQEAIQGPADAFAASMLVGDLIRCREGQGVRVEAVFAVSGGGVR